MKASVFFRFLASSAIFFLFVTFASGQNERPGIECGCTKTGKYVAPKVEKLAMTKVFYGEEGLEYSPNGKYWLTITKGVGPDEVSISIIYLGMTIFNETNTATSWGFSPDEDRFVMFGQDGNSFWIRLVNLNPYPGQDGEPATVENLFSATNLSSANISFSPHGKYLLFAGIDNTHGSGPQLILYIFNSKTGDEVYSIAGTSIVGYVSGRSVEGWGFSPDNSDATFVHSYQTTSEQYSLRVIKLSSSSHEEISESDNMLESARFLFSPCGDYFAYISGSSGTLIKTVSGNAPATFGTGSYKNLYSDSNGHYIKYTDESTAKIVNNTADDLCDDTTNPKWENETLELVEAKGTTIELKWDGASDESAAGVTSYRIYYKKDGSVNFEVADEIEAVKKYTANELEQATEYTFRIEAGDETGNWSDDGPERQFSTRPDYAPTWPDPELTFDGKTETKITVNWKAASDDYGITSYKIFINSGEVGSVAGDELKYRIKNLKAGTKYTFTVKAGDAAGQWISSEDKEVTMEPNVKPFWPPGAVLKDSAVTETSLVIYWPPSEDNFKPVKSYKIIMEQDTIAQIQYYNNSFLVTGLEEDNDYLLEVIAVDESDIEGPALSGTFSTLPPYVIDPLITGGKNQRRPDIDGKMVVWWSDTLDAGDIYSYDLEIDSLRRVTNNPYAQFDPAVSGDRIVWTDARNLNNDIYMYDPVLGEKPVCTAPLFQQMPAIDGDIIVWEDFRNGNYDIYIYDIKTGKETPVSTRKSNQRWPDVSGNYIVYADDRNGNWDIFLYDIYHGKESAACTEEHDQTYPVVTNKWREELIVAYMDNRSTKDIYVYYPDLFGKQEWEVLAPLDVYPLKTPQSYPHIEDNLLVYQDLLGIEGNDFNIYAQMLTVTGSFIGTRKEICVDYYSAMDQLRPRTSKGNIVWQDARKGNSDIYIWHRPPFSDLQISVKEITDPITVGDTLKYIVTVKNNGPRMNTSIKTVCTLSELADLDTYIADKGDVKLYGSTAKWDIDTLRNGASASLEIKMATFDLVILDFKASVKGKDFDPDNSNNEISAKTRVREFIPSFIGTGNNPSIEVEPDGRSHLIYFQNDYLKYATSPRKGTWEHRSLGSCFSCVENDMVLDKDGNIQIVAFDDIYSSDGSYARHRLYHWTLNSEGQWSRKIIALSDSGFHSLSLKTDSYNELHLIFQNAPGCAYHENLKEMRTVGGKWTQPVIFADAYDYADMTIDKEDNLHSGYYVVDTGPVYQKKINSGNGSWNEYEVIEPGWNGSGEGMTISIATDESLNPHVLYAGGTYNRPYNHIKYAYKTDEKWNIEMIDEESNSPGPIVIDPDGEVVLSYLTGPHNLYSTYPDRHVRYATNIAGPWIKQTVSETIGNLAHSWFVYTTDMGRDMDKYTHFVFTGGSDSLLYALAPPLKYFEIDPDTLDFMSVEPGSEKTIPVKLTNPSSENIIIDSITVKDERISFDNTSFILYPYSSESVNVTLKQTDALWKDTYMRIWYNSTSGLFMDVPVTAKNWVPVLTIDQDPVDFGAVNLNTLVAKTVTLKNTGAIDLIISGITVNATPVDFKLVGQTCSTLQPGQTCDAEISFKPSTSGIRQSYLNISSNDPLTPIKKVGLKGKTPNAQIYCSCTNNTIDFGYCPVGQSVTKILTVKNTGDQTLTITSATLSGTHSNQFSLSNPCTSLEPGTECNMQITMFPVLAADLNATISIKSNSQYSSTYTLSLKGSSLVRTLELSATLMSFGSVHIGEQLQKFLELRNTGSVDLKVGSIRIEGNNCCDFRQNSLTPPPFSIAAGTTSAVTVSFIPQSDGEKTADLVIESNDTYNPVQKVTLSGQAGSAVPLQVNISADPNAGSEPLQVTFDAVVTGGEPPYICKWDFDDMKTGEDLPVVHKFTGPGIFNVSLKVTDISGNSISATTKISVTAEGVPVVIATAQPHNGEIPLSVQFNAQVTGGDAPLTYLWDFRDGSTSTLQNPAHVFTSAGNYPVILSVTDTDSDKCRDSVLVNAMLNNSIAGQLWNETGLNQVAKANLILYPQTNINETTSLTVNGSNSYIFPGLPVTNYTVQAVPDTVFYYDLLPTYFGDKIALFEASWVQASGHVTGKDIRLVKKPLTGTGLGTITGYMVYGSGKGLTITEKPSESKGDPVAGAYVFLKSTTDGKLKACCKTGSDGSFRFEKLGNGSYYFVADCQGKPMDNTNTPLVISDSEQSLEILATVGTDRITVQNLTTGIADEILPGMKVYPVPAGDHIIIIIPQALFRGSYVRIRMLDLSGKNLHIDNEYDLSGGPITLDINTLSEGMYLLEVTDKTTSQRVKIVKIR